MVAQMKLHHLSFPFFPKSNPLQKMMCPSVGSARTFRSSLKILISTNILLTSTLEPNSTTTYLRWDYSIRLYDHFLIFLITECSFQMSGRGLSLRHQGPSQPHCPLWRDAQERVQAPQQHLGRVQRVRGREQPSDVRPSGSSSRRPGAWARTRRRPRPSWRGGRSQRWPSRGRV